MAIYGTSKRAVDYFSRSLAREAAGTGVIVGQINPGMVITDMLREGYTSSVRDPAAIRRVYNIMATTPDDAAGFIVKRVLANRKTNVLINRQPRYVVLARLLAAPFRGQRRDVLAEKSR
jgi:short-subunit dehydrogenase